MAVESALLIRLLLPVQILHRPCKKPLGYLSKIFSAKNLLHHTRISVYSAWALPHPYNREEVPGDSAGNVLNKTESEP